MAKLLLHESSATPLKREGSVWSAVYITPGKGSSGTYSDEMLAEYAPAAFPVGTKHYFKHPDNPGDQRDPRDQWGVTIEGKGYENGKGYSGAIKVLPHWQTVVDSLAEAGQASLSIWAMGETDDDGNVTALIPDVQNTVDLVAYPGRPGSGLTEKMYESARAASEKPGVTSAHQDKKEGKMDEKVLEALNALIAKFDTFVTESKAAAQANVKAEADADAIEKAKSEAVESAVNSYGEKVEAIDAVEGLLASQKVSLLEAAKKGDDVAPLIEKAKAVIAEFEAKSKSSGYVTEGANKSDDFSVAGLVAE